MTSVSSHAPVRDSRRAGIRSPTMVRQACEELGRTTASLGKLRVHEQFRAEVASLRCAASAFGVRDEAAVRTHYCTLLRRLHAYATVDGYTKSTISSQGQVLGSRKRARLLKVVFTKVCSRISKSSASVCGTSGGTGDALSVKER